MGKLSPDRAWWLRKWAVGGWSVGDPMRGHVKKWKAHTEALLKAGFLEADEYEMHRITDAGRKALSEHRDA